MASRYGSTCSIVSVRNGSKNRKAVNHHSPGSRGAPRKRAARHIRTPRWFNNPLCMFADAIVQTRWATLRKILKPYRQSKFNSNIDFSEELRHQGRYGEPFRSSEFPRVRFNREVRFNTGCGPTKGDGPLRPLIAGAFHPFCSRQLPSPLQYSAVY